MIVLQQKAWVNWKKHMKDFWIIPTCWGLFTNIKYNTNNQKIVYNENVLVAALRCYWKTVWVASSFVKQVFKLSFTAVVRLCCVNVSAHTVWQQQTKALLKTKRLIVVEGGRLPTSVYDSCTLAAFQRNGLRRMPADFCFLSNGKIISWWDCI